MAQGTLWFQPIQRSWTNTGSTSSGSLLFFYAAGTTTPITVYADVGLSTPLTQPVVADSNGVFVEIFLTPGTAYKVDLQTSGGVSQTGYPADNQLAIPASAANVDISETAGESLTAGLVAYLSDGSGGKTSGQIYKADSSNAYSSTLPIVGMVPSAIAASSTGVMRIEGQVSGLVGLTAGVDYYIGTTGALTSTPPTNARYIGRADSATSLIVAGNPRPYLNGTVNGVLLSAGPGLAPTTTAVLGNGQLLIGNAGNPPTLATLTAGTGISVTNGAGSITVAATNPLSGHVASDFNVSSSTTLVNVTGLSVTLASSTVYQIRIVATQTVDATGGAKFAIGGTVTLTNGTLNYLTINGSIPAVTAESRSTGAFSIPTASINSYGSASNTQFTTYVDGVLEVNAGGTLTFQFAQSAASGTSTVLRDSFIVAVPIN